MSKKLEQALKKCRELKKKCIYLADNKYCKYRNYQDKLKYGYGYLDENQCILNYCDYTLSYCYLLTTKYNIIKRIKNYFKLFKRRK